MHDWKQDNVVLDGHRPLDGVQRTCNLCELQHQTLWRSTLGGAQVRCPSQSSSQKIGWVPESWDNSSCSERLLGARHLGVSEYGDVWGRKTQTSRNLHRFSVERMSVKNYPVYRIRPGGWDGHLLIRQRIYQKSFMVLIISFVLCMTIRYYILGVYQRKYRSSWRRFGKYTTRYL